MQESMFFQPYSQRHFLSSFRFNTLPDARVGVELNYLVVRSMHNECAEVLSVGRCFDVVVRTGERLLFEVKRCVFDNDLIPNSVIYPI